MKGMKYDSGNGPEVVMKNANFRIPSGQSLTNEGSQTNSGLVTNSGGVIGAAVFSGASVAGTITAAQSGKTFIFNHADGGTYTLPTKAVNLRYSFVVGVVPTNGNQVVASAGSADDINGGVTVNGSPAVADAEDTAFFVASTCKIGDQMDFLCDATQWILTGVSHASGGVDFS